jgi:hypothetical protein
MRDIKTINDSYIPSAYRSGFYMKIGVNLLLASFFVFVLMGVIGEYAGAARTSITLILVVVFLVGLLAFFYSKWIEQGGIRQGAELVRKMIDIDVNPRYENSQYKVRWTVRPPRARVRPGGGSGSRAGVRRRGLRCLRRGCLHMFSTAHAQHAARTHTHGHSVGSGDCPPPHTLHTPTHTHTPQLKAVHISRAAAD